MSNTQQAKQQLAVSILTRPEGRVQPPGSVEQRHDFVFQSSPDPKAGCNTRMRDLGYRYMEVSILTRPEGRVQPFTGKA